MSVHVEAGQLRQPRRVRSRRVAKGALGLAAAALVIVPLATGVLSAFQVRPHGPPAHLAEADGLTLVMNCGADAFVSPMPLARPLASRVARSAGYDGKPGGTPDFEDGVLEEEDEKEEEPAIKLKPGEETEEMQNARVVTMTKWLKGLKGKFVPFGPKPWDKRAFTKVIMQIRLKPAQAGNTKIMNQCIDELRRITGVHPTIVKAKNNNAVFGWRVGMPCGVMVTMKGPLMLDFLTRLNTIILPRVRDFEGLCPTSITSFGNFWMGFENQEPFRELDELVDDRELVHGFDLGIHTNCQTQPGGLELLKNFGFPFGDPRLRKPLTRKHMNFNKRKSESGRP